MISHRQVIKGWDLCVETMSIGEKSVLHVPSVYAYGNNNLGLIPANSDLTFEVVLLSAHDSRYSMIKWQVLGFMIVLVVIYYFSQQLKHL